MRGPDDARDGRQAVGVVAGGRASDGPFGAGGRASEGPFGATVAGDGASEGPLSTTVVGSYPQPDWLIDRAVLGASSVPRVRVREAWRIPEEQLEGAQDDATVLAIREMEQAGIDTITDGEIRRESYSNRFATALDGVDAEHPDTIHTSAGEPRAVPRIVGPVRWRGPVEVRDVQFLGRHTGRATKITLPGPFTMAQQASNHAYRDPDELVMDFAAAVNREAHALEAAGVDVIQLDEPWLRNDPEGARRIAVAAINRALAGLSVTTAVHLCFGYAALVGTKDRNRYDFLGELSESDADQVSIESAQPRLDLGQLSELGAKTVVLGVIDLGDPEVESAELVAKRLRAALAHVPAERLIAAPDCGMKYLPRATAHAKLVALSAGAALVRAEL
jgi:5-methyltetrahydropteroyltriglutamate--homocysteine methyltransferase